MTTELYFNNETIKKASKRTTFDTYLEALYSFGNFGFVKHISFKDKNSLNTISVFSSFISLENYSRLINEGMTDAEEIYEITTFTDNIFEYTRKKWSNVYIDDSGYQFLLEEHKKMNIAHKEKFVKEIQCMIDNHKTPTYQEKYTVR
ncbi:hypothetical protein [Burkholderia cenocepacia]|uniref:hypothetical protein n=1 Tax=Burkholderia cenocepacia TaxID=95486 RepID=UPI002237CEBB|nr:hypothetical protein [Burkholderia cenocepacia]MCW5156335.1 hypothetical protein [Burkholderia cenocepacia]